MCPDPEQRYNISSGGESGGEVQVNEDDILIYIPPISSVSRPDMKMLEIPEYALFEIHEFGERRLGIDEKPLLGET